MARLTELPNRQSRLLSRIQAVLATLSNNDRLIAEHLLNGFPRGAWQTVETVAAEVKVSKAAVIRFATRLGYEGFAELQRDLQEEVSDIFASPLSLLQAMAPSKGHETFERFRQSVVRNLTAQPSHGAAEQVMELAKRIAKCTGRVFFVGASKSYAAAYYAHYMLNLIVPNAVLVPTEVSTLPNALLDIGPKDILIGVCVRRYSTVTVLALKHAKERGTHVVVLTDTLLAPPARIAPAVIVAPSESHSLFDSAVMLIFYLEAIAAAVAVECREAASNRLAEAVKLAREFGTFEDSKA